MIGLLELPGAGAVGVNCRGGAIGPPALVFDGAIARRVAGNPEWVALYGILPAP